MRGYFQSPQSKSLRLSFSVWLKTRSASPASPAAPTFFAVEQRSLAWHCDESANASERLSRRELSGFGIWREHRQVDVPNAVEDPFWPLAPPTLRSGVELL